MFGEYIDTGDRIPEGILKLKKEQRIYLYGTGIYAKNMLKILDKFHIEIEGVLISKQFGSQAQTLCGNQIYIAETFLNTVDSDIVVVAGFHIIYHRELTNRLILDTHIKTIYVLNGCELFWENGFKFFEPKVYLVDNYYEGLIRRNLTYQYFSDNYQKFYQTYEWLKDKKSKKTMDEFLKGAIELTAFPMLSVWTVDDVEKQYFSEDIIQLDDREVFVDCGAYTGDTLESFLKRTRTFKRYYALEPDKRHYDELYSKMVKDVIHIPVGVWNQKDYLNFSVENECGEISIDTKAAENGIHVDKIDDLISEDITFIKMDVEGAELLALYGAAKTIKRCKPKLAICVYHKREDLITIPQFIKSLVPEYTLYLRAHFAYASELVLYAVCK